MNLELIFGIIIGLILIIGFICYFLNERKTIKEWLFFAVTEAEKLLGSKVGKLKLAQVFSKFIEAFPIFSKFVKFKTFSKWVDLALEQMKKYLEDNQKAKTYVGIEETEK